MLRRAIRSLRLASSCTHPAFARHGRSGLSFTLVLNNPTGYDGGELIIKDGTGAVRSSCRAAIGKAKNLVDNHSHSYNMG
ncbi:MAG: hypothetical protein Q7J36_16375 [Thiobacillus sp.]|nr:hypothetical protein [Thiobacillus sp.]